jgi:type VI secretion system secreted protein VgrG
MGGLAMAKMEDFVEVSIVSPLGEGVLLFQSMTGEEELGRLFRYQIHVFSEDHDIAAEDLIGQNVTVSLRFADDTERHFNGFATVFDYVGVFLDYAHYHLTLEPWLGLLSRTVNCRIFQEKTVPDIAELVFREHGFSDFELRLSGDYLTSEFCVQFEESLLDFLCRRFEHEGIYFYFLHEKDKHTLVLCDSLSSHDLVTELEEIPFNPKSVDGVHEQDSIYSWKTRTQLVPGTVTLNSYDFKSPRAKLLARSSDPAMHAYSDFEVFEFEDEYVKQSKGEEYANIRREEQNAKRHVGEAVCNVRGLYCGALYKMIDHPRMSENIEYLITSSRYELYGDDEYFPREERVEREKYMLALTAIDSQVPYRPPRVTPIPKVEGPQTATVVGKAGEDIWTDEFGRIKVRFHWDRDSDGDENSSCWIRVVQNRAGKGWGELYLPHILQEVVVSFIGGDPDIPLVTGRLYNADNKPPLELPADKTKVAMRDQGGNQVIMQGKGGGEQQIQIYSPTEETKISMGAPNSPWNVVFSTLGTALQTWAAGAHKTEVDGGGNETKTVNANTTENLNGWKFTHITGWKKSFTDGNTETITLGNAISTTAGTSHTSRLGADSAISASLKHTTTVGVDVSEFVGAKAAYAMAVNLSRTAGAKADWAAAVDLRNRAGNSIENCSAKIVKSSAGISAYQAGALMYVTGKPLELNGSGSAILKSGGAVIRLASGSVEITGGPIRLKGDVIIEKNLNVDGKINDK